MRVEEKVMVEKHNIIPWDSLKAVFIVLSSIVFGAKQDGLRPNNLPDDGPLPIAFLQPLLQAPSQRTSLSHLAHLSLLLRVFDSPQAILLRLRSTSAPPSSGRMTGSTRRHMTGSHPANGLLSGQKDNRQAKMALPRNAAKGKQLHFRRMCISYAWQQSRILEVVAARELRAADYPYEAISLISYVRKSSTTAIIVTCLAFSKPRKPPKWQNHMVIKQEYIRNREKANQKTKNYLR
ncbi:unnamed protein product [Dovyalis caffra]|uniref:Uncharacterized protein n=1 Tax=Dovyalis caffra TaxID=77055 RepID=A0AAV1SEH6_9ROSI|nr:unnamed protein product [Dovyalis caffra]